MQSARLSSGKDAGREKQISSWQQVPWELVAGLWEQLPFSFPPYGKGFYWVLAIRTAYRNSHWAHASSLAFSSSPTVGSEQSLQTGGKTELCIEKEEKTWREGCVIRL